MSPRLALCLALVALLAVPVAAETRDVHLEIGHGPYGPVAGVMEAPAAAPETAPTEPVVGGDRDATERWHRFLADAIYTSTGLALNTVGMAGAGTYLNPPRHLEATPLDGDGTPAWTHPDNTVYMDASAGTGRFASVSFNDADSTATVREFSYDSGTPLWTFVIHPCRSLTYSGWASRKPIRFSEDGTAVAVAVVMWADGGQRGRMFAFDSGNGTPTDDFDFPTGNVVATAISGDGDVVAMTGWPNVYVYDRNLGGLRWSGPAGAGNDALDLSGDGSYLAWGWTTLYLREWDGATYVPVWTQPAGAGTYVGQVAISPTQDRIAVAWDNGNSFPNEIVVSLYELPSLAPLWSYDYGPGGYVHVDIPSQMIWDGWGYRFAVASWGGSFPEVHVFDRGSSEPILTLDTPGSMFDIDISAGYPGYSELTFCGKNVHAGTGGRGGDLYAYVIWPPSGVPDGPAAPAGLSLGPCVPNPFNPSTALTYRLERAGAIRLAVHDARGRLVRVLAEGRREAGEHGVSWDGRDGTGSEVASGIYVVSLEGEGGAARAKAVLIK